VIVWVSFLTTSFGQKADQQKHKKDTHADRVDDRQAGRRAFEYLAAEDIFGPPLLPIYLEK
jgi:hypothetical protein